jgi:hypothetical protein
LGALRRQHKRMAMGELMPYQPCGRGRPVTPCGGLASDHWRHPCPTQPPS